MEEEEEEVHPTTTTRHKRGGRRRTRPSNSSAPGETTFHLLCTYSTSGAVIGNSGSIIKLLQKQTGTRIYAEKYLSRSDERIITIIGPKSPNKTITLLNKEEEEAQVSPAQYGLIRVLETVWEVEAAGDEEDNKLVPVICRLLADYNQIGYVKGRGGNRVKKLESDYKTKIWVFNNAPSCAPPSYQVIQIAGACLAVKRATLAVSQCLQDEAPDRHFPDSYTKSLSRESSLPHQVSGSVDWASRGYSVPGEEEVVFRLLCSEDRIGGVIGKRRNMIKALEDETGAFIRAGAPVAESNDRVIHISATENAGSLCSPAQDAVICVFKRSIEDGNGEKLVSDASKDPIVEARLLISLDQTVCLTGVGGAIISEMRKITSTNMWILRGDEVPPCAAENDAVVKIEGSGQNVQHALFIVTGKLRNTIFCNNMANTSGKIRETSAADSYPLLDHSCKPGPRATLTEGMHRLGLSHAIDHSASPEPWKSKMMHGAVGDPRCGLENGSGRKSAVVMNSSFEILVPEYIISSDYGEKESNLNILRQVSGARISVHDPFPGSCEATLLISGTPDQTQIAQSVLEALILKGENS